MSVRRAVARPVESSDLMEDVLRYEHAVLDDRQKSALRLTDAFLAYPEGWRGPRCAEALQSCSPSQVVALTFKMVCWTTNKASIALGMDEAVSEHHLTAFDYGEEGQYVLGVDAE